MNDLCNVFFSYFIFFFIGVCYVFCVYSLINQPPFSSFSLAHNLIKLKRKKSCISSVFLFICVLRDRVNKSHIKKWEISLMANYWLLFWLRRNRRIEIVFCWHGCAFNKPLSSIRSQEEGISFWKIVNVFLASCSIF